MTGENVIKLLSYSVKRCYNTIIPRAIDNEYERHAINLKAHKLRFLVFVLYLGGVDSVTVEPILDIDFKPMDKRLSFENRGDYGVLNWNLNG